MKVITFLLVLGLSIATGTAEAKALWRVYYSEEPVSASQHAFLERIYGAKVMILPYRPLYPAKPTRKSGIVLHSDEIEDPLYLMGDENPNLEGPELQNRLGDKWHEAEFLTANSPFLAPETSLATDFVKPGASADSLEAIRAAITAKMGRCILKIRTGFGSDGELPSTDKSWTGIYADFLRETKPALERIRKTHNDGDIIQELSAELPHRKGIVLDELLAHPESIIVQKMVDADKEVRVHVVRGRILKGATGLRYDFFRKFVLPSEIEEIESAVEEHLLSKIRAKYPEFSAGMDIMVERGPDGKARPRIIDLNIGNYSGMFDPDSDIYITNLLSEFFTGRETPYLSEMRAFFASPIAEKPARLAALRQTYGAFVDEYETSGFWDRVGDAYYDELARADPASRPALFDTALSQLETVLPDEAWIAHQLISAAQASWPELMLPADRLDYHVSALSKIGGGVFTYANHGRIDGYEWEHDREALVDFAAELVRKNPDVAIALRNFYTQERARIEPPSLPWVDSKLREDRAILIEGTLPAFIAEVKARVRTGREHEYTDSTLARFLGGYFRKLVRARSLIVGHAISKAEAKAFARMIVARYVAKKKHGQVKALGPEAWKEAGEKKFFYKGRRRDLIARLLRDLHQAAPRGKYSDGKLNRILEGTHPVDRVAVLLTAHDAAALASAWRKGSAPPALLARIRAIETFLLNPAIPMPKLRADEPVTCPGMLAAPRLASGHGG